MVWPFISRREKLRQEASDWFAKLRGPEADAARPAFERWYGASPEHAEAYDRIAVRFGESGVLDQGKVGRARNLGDVRHTQWRARRYAFATLMICMVVLIAYLVVARPQLSGETRPAEVASFSATAGGPRRVVLLDGSQVLLEPDSAIDVAFGENQRRLRLVRGEGRFSVAHEARPFVVAAGAAEIVAHGTQFVVRLAGSRTTVALIEGSIDVSYPATGKSAARRRTARLRPGERLTIGPNGDGRAASTVAQRSGTPSLPMLDFDDTPLSDVVARANARANPKIRLGDPSLGSLRLTGAFRAGDTRSLAASLAAAFGLRVEDASDGLVLLRPAKEGVQPR